MWPGSVPSQNPYPNHTPFEHCWPNAARFMLHPHIRLASFSSLVQGFPLLVHWCERFVHWCKGLVRFASGSFPPPLCPHCPHCPRQPPPKILEYFLRPPADSTGLGSIVKSIRKPYPVGTFFVQVKIHGLFSIIMTRNEVRVWSDIQKVSRSAICHVVIQLVSCYRYP